MILLLFTLHSHYDTPTAAVVPVLAQVYPLPCPQFWPPVRDRYIQTIAKQTRFDMRGHIVRSLVLMAVIRLIFRHSTIEVALKILAYRRVGIFVES